MKADRGFTLIELLTSMSLGLIVLSTALSFWIGLSKNSHKEIIRLQLSQEYVDVVNHLRSMLGNAILYPHCLNSEWLHYKELSSESPQWASRGDKAMIHPANNIEAFGSSEIMLNAAEEYPNLDLGDYRLRTLQGSDVIDLVFLTPLNVVDRRIVNWNSLHGGRSGNLLVTDCQSYLLGLYDRVGSDRFILDLELSRAIENHFNRDKYLQFYKISRVLMYVSYEQGQYYLISNFLDGSNFIRLPNIRGMRVKRDENDPSLLQFEVLIPKMQSDDVQSKLFYIRLLNQ